MQAESWVFDDTAKRDYVYLSLCTVFKEHVPYYTFNQTKIQNTTDVAGVLPLGTLFPLPLAP